MARRDNIFELFYRHGVHPGLHRDGSSENAQDRVDRLVQSGRSLDDIEQSIVGIAREHEIVGPMAQQVFDLFEAYGVDPSLHRDGSVEDPMDRVLRLVESGRSLDDIEDSIAGIADAHHIPDPDDSTSRDWRREAKALFPWMPEPLLDVFTDSWQEIGDPQIAINEMRQSNEYREYFPGNLQDDGTIRLDESTYIAEHETFLQELTSYGLPTDALDHLYPQFVEAGVRPDEFRQRMGMMYTEIAGNTAAVRDFYRSHFGADDLSLQSLMASALDPSTNPMVMEREIRQAQIGGEAARSGFQINLQDVERLESFGMDQQAAREFYTQAETLLPTLSTLLERHDDPQDEFTLDQLTDALVFSDPDQEQVISRLFAQEQAQFTPHGLFNITQGGRVEGIRQR